MIGVLRLFVNVCINIRNKNKIINTRFLQILYKL